MDRPANPSNFTYLSDADAIPADSVLVVLNPGWGDTIQANKAGLTEAGDVFTINKADKPGVEQTRKDLLESLALLAGLDLATAVNGLSGFSGVKGRLQIVSGPENSRIIDDSYNANPDSLEAGIKVLCSFKGAPWLALGDMAELGSEAADLHREAATTAQRHGVRKFFGVGEMSCLASEEFGAAGACYDSIDDMAASILSQIDKDVNLLVKGSRSAGMERLIGLLTQSTNQTGDSNAV